METISCDLEDFVVVKRPALSDNNDIKSKNYGVVSLFTGCGGLDLGFTGGFSYKGEKYGKLPFEILEAYDNNPKCCVTYKNNIGEHITETDLSNFDLHKAPRADVLIGGFPCQDFSSCGPKAGLESDRGKLYNVLIRYMKIHRPKVVIAENVPHLEKMKSGKILSVILDDLQSAGYHFEVWKLFAPDYGIPQRRRRLFIVGVRDDIKGFPVMPHPMFSKSEYRSINWAIDDLIEIKDESVPNQSQYFLASRAKRGNGQGDERNKSGEPAYTIRANAKSRVQFHYKLHRRLTVRECARLQSFPDNFIFPYSATTNIMQIGNAVPPVLGFQVAKSIAAFLKEIRPKPL